MFIKIEVNNYYIKYYHDIGQLKLNKVIWKKHSIKTL